MSVFVDCLVIMADGQMAALVMAHGPGLGQDAKSGKLVPSLEVLRITSQKCYESPDKNLCFLLDRGNTTLPEVGFLRMY